MKGKWRVASEEKKEGLATEAQRDRDRRKHEPERKDNAEARRTPRFAEKKEISASEEGRIGHRGTETPRSEQGT
jgi:hypothetical protein